MHLRADRRWEAVRALAGAARARGKLIPVRRVAMAAVSPRLASQRRDRISFENIPPAWVAETAEWLDPIVAAAPVVEQTRVDAR
jgi:hypothetical protein